MCIFENILAKRGGDDDTEAVISFFLSSVVKHIWSIWNSLFSHATTSLFFCKEGFQYHLASYYVSRNTWQDKETSFNLQKGIKITGVLRKEKRHTCRYLMENPSACSLVDKSTNEAKVTQNMLRGQRFCFKASLLRHILEKSMREEDDFFPTSSASLTRLICSR